MELYGVILDSYGIMDERKENFTWCLLFSLSERERRMREEMQARGAQQTYFYEVGKSFQRINILSEPRPPPSDEARESLLCEALR